MTRAARSALPAIGSRGGRHAAAEADLPARARRSIRRTRLAYLGVATVLDLTNRTDELAALVEEPSGATSRRKG